MVYFELYFEYFENLTANFLTGLDLNELIFNEFYFHSSVYTLNNIKSDLSIILVYHNPMGQGEQS